MDRNSSTASWLCSQIIASGGVEIILTVTLPSTLGALSEDDVAVASGTFFFIRSFGLIWSVRIASIVFDGQVNGKLGGVSDPALKALLKDGAAYSYASGCFILGLEKWSRREVIELYI